MTPVELALTLISGIAWTIVYVGIIFKGIKEKSAGMPLFALGLNIAWESICTFTDIFFEAHGPVVGVNAVQIIVNAVWVVFDCAIVALYFKYGRERWPQALRKQFVSGSLIVFATCYALQIAFQLEFGAVLGAQYAAFAQNVVMSILFLVMLVNRYDTRSQALFIGVAKWLGTLAPTILFGAVSQFSPFIIITGALCSVFDIAYIVLLNMKMRHVGAIAHVPGGCALSA